MRCDECKFWVFLPRFKGSGRCHRFPRVIASEAQIKQGSRPWVYPVMDVDDYCGEFQGREVSVGCTNESVVLDEPNDVSVEVLNLSLRPHKCVIHLGIKTLSDLCQRTASDLLKCKNFGVSGLWEIQGKLKRHGLSLRGESDG